MKGIIYKYTSPSNKIYVGQTLNEERRRKEFLNLNKRYGGLKIDNARHKYNPKNFSYEILFECDYESIDFAIQDLNEKEEYYIKKYDSIKNGYNISIGGSLRCVMLDENCKQRMIKSLKNFYKNNNNAFKGRKHSEATKEILRQKSIGRKSSFKGRKHTEESKEKMRISHGNMFGENNPFYGKKHTDETKKLIGKKNSKPVVQIDIKTNEILNTFDSVKSAAMFLNKNRCESDIIRVCKGAVRFQNGYKKKCLTAHGYKWKYLEDVEGSTTTEMA